MVRITHGAARQLLLELGLIRYLVSRSGCFKYGCLIKKKNKKGTYIQNKKFPSFVLTIIIYDCPTNSMKTIIINSNMLR